MAKLYCCLLLSILSASYIQGSSVELINGKIKITVGTTSGCGDTVRFIGILADVYKDYKDFLEVEFIPWGKTRYNEDGSMWCQFGSNDCWANRLHRCVLDLLKEDQDARMSYMACEFSSPYPSYLQGSYQCATSAGLNLIDLDYCMSTSGQALDDAAQAAAKEPMAIINFVPSIHFNDVIDLDNHYHALTRLRSLICFALAEHDFTGVTDCPIY